MAHACPYTGTIGGYVLEALCTQDSDELRQHAQVCLDCQREIAELTPIGRLLEACAAQTQPANGPRL